MSARFSCSLTPKQQLVPTQFVKLSGSVIQTHQYSVTEYYTLRAPRDTLAPILSVSYDFSPVSVVIEQRRRPLLHLITRTCAVVGGAYAIMEQASRLMSG
jgi:hypothetical protein